MRRARACGAWLRTLGEREDGTARLQEAVAAYRAALEVRTRERVPLHWATTQNNLGTVLRTLGERTRSTQQLCDAVGAHAGALRVFATGAPAYAAIARRGLSNDLSTLRALFGEAAAHECAQRHGVALDE